MLPSFDVRSNIPKFSQRFYKGPVHMTKLCDDKTLTFISNLKPRQIYQYTSRKEQFIWSEVFRLKKLLLEYSTCYFYVKTIF